MDRVTVSRGKQVAVPLFCAVWEGAELQAFTYMETLLHVFVFVFFLHYGMSRSRPFMSPLKPCNLHLSHRVSLLPSKSSMTLAEIGQVLFALSLCPAAGAILRY